MHLGSVHAHTMLERGTKKLRISGDDTSRWPPMLVKGLSIGEMSGSCGSAVDDVDRGGVDAVAVAGGGEAASRRMPKLPDPGDGVWRGVAAADEAGDGDVDNGAHAR